MSFTDLLFGKPLTVYDERGEKLGVSAGIPIFGLDALSSAAYGPEAALTLLIPLGAAGVAYILPISVSIIILLSIVYFSYRQTIAAYPGGGGSYTVASQNLGPNAGVLAASALMIDYVLTAAVGISAGVGALVSAAPSLQPHTLGLCLAILAVITIVNLRGARETGAIFMLPTYAFVGTLLITLGIGLIKSLLAGGHPAPVIAPSTLPAPTVALSAWLLLKAFSSGCTAMTGVEAVSNGVRAFREPVVKTAQRTLTLIIAILIVLLAGIAYLARAYHIGATIPGAPGYQSILSQLTKAVAGGGPFYYVTMASILLVLALSANTAFADFPRLCRAVADDGFLPYPFSLLGRRLVYSEGVYVLAALCAVLLIVFGGVTDRLIPLYAVGAFLAFTLSQAGMVAHWKRVGGPGSLRYMLVNGLGALATGTTVIVVTVSKFTEGAWITALLIPAIMALMFAIRRHYDHLQAAIADSSTLDLEGVRPPMVVVPVAQWDKIAQKGLRFALLLSTDVTALHIDCGEPCEDLVKNWTRLAEEPAACAGFGIPHLVVLKSPYRFVIRPIVDYVLTLEQEHPDRQIAVLIPEFVERHWYVHFMHNQRGSLLKALLLLKGTRRTIVINVPWYLSDDLVSAPAATKNTPPQS